MKVALLLGGRLCGVESFEFVRRVDGVVYRFNLDGAGRWKRADMDLWCLRDAERGWVIADAAGEVFGWPFARRTGELPPEGGWHSAKGAKSYEYDLRWL